jgi:Ca-activated chloride channel family protein
MKAAVLCAALLVAQQISIDVDLVVFNVAVLDSKARPVKGLSKGKHQAFEDGKEQAIQFVRPEDIPATVGLVIDNSGSMRRKRAEVAQAAQKFAELSNSEDELFIVNFNERVTMGLPGGAPFTSDKDQFRTALPGYQGRRKNSTVRCRLCPR